MISFTILTANLMCDWPSLSEFSAMSVKEKERALEKKPWNRCLACVHNVKCRVHLALGKVWDIWRKKSMWVKNESKGF